MGRGKFCSAGVRAANEEVGETYIRHFEMADKGKGRDC